MSLHKKHLPYTAESGHFICYLNRTHHVLSTLGVFWVAEKRVIVYLADEALTDDDIPQQFKGDIWHRKIRDVVRDVKQLQNDMAKERQFEKQQATSATRVADISVGALLDLIRSVLNKKTIEPFSETMDRLATLVTSKTVIGAFQSSPDFVASIAPYLQALIGEPIESLKTTGKGIWTSGFSMTTTTGQWIGYSSDRTIYQGGDVEVHSGCLILHVTNGLVDASAIVSEISEIDIKEPTEYRLGKIIGHEGTVLPGVINRVSEFAIASNPS